MQRETPFPQNVLDLMEVPAAQFRNVFVLGCFGTYITMYSQQVRALNLVTALHTCGKLRDGTRVCIIGAGAAGLTAAVASVKLGAKVRLLETNFHPMYMQRTCAKRYIHPFIYDWPNMESNSDSTNLGILDWSAGLANEVAKHIEKSYLTTIRQYSMDRFSATWEALNVDIDERSEASEDLTVTWKLRSKGDDAGHFDIVILAIGFGLEELGQTGLTRYWDDDSLDNIDVMAKQCIVLGNGDGALTDLIRLCIRDFRHGEFVKLFSTDEEAIKAGQALLDAEKLYLKTNRTHADREKLTEIYKSVRLEKLIHRISTEDYLRPDTVVYLTGKTFWHIYTSRSSILNRLIAVQLNHIGAWAWYGKDAELSRRTSSSGKFVVVKGKKIAEFDIAIRRHGPKPSLEVSFPKVWEAAQPLQRTWRDLSPHNDPTRIPYQWGDIFGTSSNNFANTGTIDRPRGWCKLVVFDLDGTLLQGTGYKWSWKLLWQHLKYDDRTRAELMSKYLDKEISYKEWCDRSAVLFRDRKLKRSDFAEITKNISVVAGFHETVTALKQAGVRMAIVSGGIDTFIDVLLPEARNIFDRIFINRFQYDGDGILASIDHTPYDFAGKLEAIDLLCKEYGILRTDVAFVGDGFNDESVLNHVGTAIAFMPQAMVMKENADHLIESPNLTEVLKHIIG